MCLFNKLLHDYHDRLRVERLMFNFQPDEIIEKEYSVTDLLHIIEQYAPDAAYVKCRPGHSFTLADAHFQVLYSQEDAVNARDASEPMFAYVTLRSLLPRPKFFFASEGTVFGLIPTEGGFKVSQTPIFCGPDDGTYNC